MSSQSWHTTSASSRTEKNQLPELAQHQEQGLAQLPELERAQHQEQGLAQLLELGSEQG